MSSMYYKVTPEPAPSPRFGFKKVDRKELQEILSRVTRPKPSFAERPATASSTTRPKSSQSARRKKYPTEQDWQKMIRRIQRPTFSHKMARNRKDNSQNEQQQQQQSREVTLPRPKSSKPIVTKGLDKLCRPTTASTAKSLLTCHLCGANSSADSRPMYFENDLSDDKARHPEEVETITERVRMHTCSSHPESRPCTRGKVSDSPDSMIQDSRLPLISGLDRSKTVTEITERLRSGKNRYTAPAATLITT